VEGKIFSGEGKASEFLRINEYSEFIKEKTGFKPFPGTLNLRAEPEEIQRLKDRAETERMEGFEKQGKEFGGLKLYHVKFQDINCCIIEPDLTRYGDDVIEICSEFRLRSRFNLDDGDQIEICAEK
jgi:riboflavin kinase